VKRCRITRMTCGKPSYSRGKGKQSEVLLILNTESWRRHGSRLLSPVSELCEQWLTWIKLLPRHFYTIEQVASLREGLPHSLVTYPLWQMAEHLLPRGFNTTDVDNPVKLHLRLVYNPVLLYVLVYFPAEGKVGLWQIQYQCVPRNKV
jgi:hypothetical protein